MKRLACIMFGHRQARRLLLPKGGVRIAIRFCTRCGDL